MWLIALIILGIIAVIIALIMLIPIGADVAYEGGELRLSAKIAGVLLQLLPKEPEDESKPKEEKKPKKEKKPKESESGEAKPKKKLSLDFTFDEIMALLKKVLGAFGKFGRKFRVDRFLLDYTAAGDDPYQTAVVFGQVNAALNILAPICSQRFDVDDLYVHTDVDFTAEKTKLDFGIALTVRIGAIFHMVFSILFGALGILIKNKFRHFKEKLMRRKNGDVETSEENAENNIAENDIKESNEQQEERIDKNGK